MTTPTPRSNREWRELAEQAQRELAAAQDNRQYTCEAHRDEVKKGGRCVWCDLAAAQERIRKSEADIAAMTTYAKTQQDRAQAAEAERDEIKRHAEAMAEELQWIACRYDDSKSTRECAADAYEMKSAAAQALHAYRAAHQDGGAK